MTPRNEEYIALMTQLGKMSHELQTINATLIAIYSEQLKNKDKEKQA